MPDWQSLMHFWQGLGEGKGELSVRHLMFTPQGNRANLVCKVQNCQLVRPGVEHTVLRKGKAECCQMESSILDTVIVVFNMQFFEFDVLTPEQKKNKPSADPVIEILIYL